MLACGPRVTAFAPGDAVVALLDHRGGGQAERVLLPQARAVGAPPSLPPEEAAALVLSGLTALQALHDRARLGSRRDAAVLVVGAAGGIGSFAVQLAVLAGARVTAVADRAREPFVTGLGAAEVLDRHRDDPFAPGRRYDVVLDTPGVLPAERVLPALTPDGVLVGTRPLDPAVLRRLLLPGRRTGPRPTVVRTRPRPQDVARLLALAAVGRLRVPVDRVLPLADAAAAHAHAASGGVRGKVVVRVAG